MKRLIAIFVGFASFLSSALGDQVVNLNGAAGGRRFEGIGAVDGGGATSVLLKDYPEPQRSEILDLLFKPQFGASMSALLVEVPGDGNSTQGTMPSHMHAHDDLNYRRGYLWWIMQAAKRRNPRLTLDACAWGCPGWVGHGDFWSQDMCDYYVKWIQGLQSVYGLNLDAIGCRNESGVHEDFVKKFRATLNTNGLARVKIHAFDNWPTNKWDWVKDLETDVELRNAVDILGNHIFYDSPPPAVRAMAAKYHKPIWETEAHVYKQGFDCLISLVQAFNYNFIHSGATRTVAWYDVAALYPLEPFPVDPSCLIANSPWSGHYVVREALWGYAHYGQFAQPGWQYLDGACGDLAGGGSFVTLKSPGKDYSVILETKDAKAVQYLTFNVSGGLSRDQLCVWRSDVEEQFVPQPEINPEQGTFAIALKPNTVYSLSTIRGQQKGFFSPVPAEQNFPFPYYETFEEYASPAQWGYLPHYTADISSVFEIAERPDKQGKCLRQVVGTQPQSWAPDWLPYTVIGDEHWQDYEVSADVYLENAGWAGVMGRVNDVGDGFGCAPKGYYLALAPDGRCALFSVSGKAGRKELGDAEHQARLKASGFAEEKGEEQLAVGFARNVASHQWHNLKLQFLGATLAGVVDGAPVLSVTNALFARGMVGLVTGDSQTRNTACFDNLLIKAVGAPTPKPTLVTRTPMYPR